VLPFVTAPAQRTTRRVGNEATGVLELEVRGGLTVAESDTIADLCTSEQSSLTAGAKLADAIATEEGISITEAFQIIENTIGGRTLEERAKAISLRHAERIEQVHRIYTAASRLSSEATVTALIRHRCALPQWSMDDTRGLVRPLFDDIWALALDEQEAEALPSSPPSEADLKKPQPETPPAPKRTGKASSGS
jgi:hypothetical protein